MDPGAHCGAAIPCLPVDRSSELLVRQDRLLPRRLAQLMPRASWVILWASFFGGVSRFAVLARRRLLVGAYAVAAPPDVDHGGVVEKA
jgi:hypothetical protein